ncbi:MAG: right-handed parallel beta-helix repeat-containing protein, partial [bacterium]|nr:right-handed parallel beta-helix repeat-containing protein [bacterium]
GDLSQGRDDDSDGDKVPNIEEYRRGSDPLAVPHWYVDGSVAKSGDGTLWETAFKTIQEGIDAASHGDTVIVAKGTYVENIHFDAKNIVLRSTDPLDPEVVASTVIEGDQYGPVVWFSGAEDESCVLSGFTIRGGRADQGAGICGGNEWDHTHATIQNNVITGNRAEAWGGGYGGGLADCDGMIQNNTISGNQADFGGGLLCCHGTIQNNTISANSAMGVSHRGAGLYDCDGNIQNNTITDNEATDGGGGLSMCDGTIGGNVIARNSANYGGGLHSCDGTIRNNIITSNLAHYGGGLETCRGMIENNTICDNSAEYSAGGLDYCRGTIVNCVIWGNRGFGQLSNSSVPTYSCIQAWTGGGQGNISDYPYFVDVPNGDFHLKSWSPCIDAGSPGSPFRNEPDPNGGRINMGSYGNTPDATSKSPDEDGDRLPDDWEMESFASLSQEGKDDADTDLISNIEEYRRGLSPTAPVSVWYVDGSAAFPGDGSSWETAFKAIQEGIDAACHGDTVIVAQGTYLENIRFDGKNIVLTSTDPLNPNVVAGTVVDGRQAGIVVTFDGTEDGSCLLSGFTIRNGYGYHGGGVCGGNATIEHNVIAGNQSRYDGAGLYHCDGIIQDNIISTNSAGRHGGGLLRCGGIIRNNTISNNVADRYGGGVKECHGLLENNTISGNSAGDDAGVYACDGLIQNNTICHNWAGRDGGGVSDCTGTIRGNIISHNSVGRDGAGLHWLFSTAGIIQNNIVVGNSAGRNGGGLNGCQGTIRNNLIAGNSAAESGGGLYGCYEPIRSNTIVGNSAGVSGGGLASCPTGVLNCVIWGNDAASGAQLSEAPAPRYSCIEKWEQGGEGNVAQDPRFVDPDGPDDDPETYEDNNYRLSPDSPCIDVGLNESWMGDAVDLDRNSRIFRGVSSLTVDMGAYEYPSPRPPEVAFTVISSHGAPDPPAGTYAYLPGDTVPAGSVGSPADAEGGVRYRCTGYGGTGSAPSGFGSVFPGFAVREDSTLTWGWIAQYRVTVPLVENGVLRPKGANWHDAGGDATFTAYPNDDYLLDMWFVDGENVQTGGDTFTLRNIEAPHEVTASFLKSHSIVVRSNMEAGYELRRLPDGEPVRGLTQPTDDPNVFEAVHEDMELGNWELTWLPSAEAWPRQPVTETEMLKEGGVILFRKDYIMKVPSDIYELAMEPIQYATGIFTARLRITNASGLENPPSRTFTAPMWVVIKDIVFTVSGPNSEGRLWNADGMTSAEYPDSGEYYYVDVSSWAPLGPGETSPEVVLEFYVKDRNPNFRPVIEVWAYDPVTDSYPGSLRCSIRLTSLPGGSILLNWETAAGQLYTVEAADSPMGPWIAISDDIPFGEGVAQWVDSALGEIRCRFYRIRVVFP